MVQRADTLAEVAYRQVRQAILAGDLEPGQTVSIVALAGQMGMSRSPVRTAVGRLSSDGLVDLTAGGVRVPLPDRHDLMDSLAVRSPLEGLAARLSAPHIDLDDIADLEDIHKRFEDAVEASLPREARAADLEFHQRIQSRCGNMQLLEHLDRVQARVIIATYSTAWGAAQRQAVTEHAQILEALRRQDGEAAQRAAVTHLDNLVRRITQEWKRRDSGQ